MVAPEHCCFIYISGAGSHSAPLYETQVAMKVCRFDR